MPTIFFIRHGESASNIGAITTEHESIPLTPFGHAQANAVAKAFPTAPKKVLVSPMARTRQTAEPYCTLHRAQPEVCEALAEFGVIDPDLIRGLNGNQRKPFVADYWANPAPERRLGPRADTFLEFNERVSTFLSLMPTLPNSTVIFGHGIWFGLLQWRLMGLAAQSAEDMRRFRRFQQGFPMPNCAIFSLSSASGRAWSTRVELDIMREAGID